MLKTFDRIYGEIIIDDPLVISLIETPAFQRLKRINQYGGVNFVYPTYQVTRYEHSIAVWWILYKLGCSLEIQINGLLHDIGHAAFSHMLDMAKSDKSESFHEVKVPNFDLMKPINTILEERRIKLANPDEFPEIKRPLPDVGADRIDYAVRDYYGAIGENTQFGQEVIDNLTIVDRNIVFTDPKVAEKYALTGLESMQKAIYDPKVAVVYQAIVEMFRVGLSEKWIVEEDLMQDDLHILNIFKKNRGRFPSKYIDVFEVPFVAEEVSEESEYDFFFVKLKARYFDPLVKNDNGAKRLSEINSHFSKSLREKIKLFEKHKTGVYIKVKFLK